MLNAKEQLLDVIKTLPDDATWNDALYMVYLLSEVKQGEEDIQNGRVMTIEEAIERMKEEHEEFNFEKSFWSH